MKPMYRDIWCLAPSDNGYPGGFPRGFINRIRKKWWGTRRCWLFSGGFKDEGGVTVDIKPELKPAVVANCEQLPFPDESFDFVLADPPYSEKEASDLYKMPYFNINKVVNEAARITKSGGYFLFLHRLVPQTILGENTHFKRMEMVGVVGVFTLGGVSNMRALTVFRKSESIVEYLDKI